jgi:hypothetical protein
VGFGGLTPALRTTGDVRTGISPSAEECSSIASSNYNALQTSLTKNFSKGLQFLATYTWSRSLDDGSGSSSNSLDLGSIVGDVTNLRANYGPSTFNLENRFVVSFVYEIPHFTVKSRSVDAVLNHWGFAGILLLQSGFPFSITDSKSGTIYGHSGFAQCVAGIEQYTMGSVVHRLSDYINPAASAPAPALDGGTGFGDCGRDVLVGPPEKNLDFALHRVFPIHEAINIQFRAEAFNATNHPNFGNPASNVSSPATFGVISTTVSNPRILQLALKLNF